MKITNQLNRSGLGEDLGRLYSLDPGMKSERISPVSFMKGNP
jgi:hypothetical protein